MTYRAPVPVGPENKTWTETLSTKSAFTEVAVALTDSSLALQRAEEVIEGSDLKAMVRGFRDRRHDSLRELREVGLAAGLRADGIPASGTEKLRRTWMTLKSKLAENASVLKVLIDEEEDAAGTLKEFRGRNLPSAVDNVVGSAIVQIENDIEILSETHSKL